MVLQSGWEPPNGWLGTPYPIMCGWELEVTYKLILRGYAVTRMVLYK